MEGGEHIPFKEQEEDVRRPLHLNQIEERNGQATKGDVRMDDDVETVQAGYNEQPFKTFRDSAL